MLTSYFARPNRSIHLHSHPSGDYLLSAGADGAWAFHSIEEAKTVFSVAGDQPLTTAAFHPDGLILATGTNATSGIVKIWDIRTQNVAFECPEQHAGGVSSLAFSENGFNFATATSGEDGVVKIWDLRKLSKTGEMTMDGGVVRSIKYDYSGMYLAVAGSDLRYVKCACVCVC